MKAILQTFRQRASLVRLFSIALLIAVTFTALMPSVFINPATVVALSMGSAEIILLAGAIAITMLTAGIDLSVVAMANLTAVVAALIMRANPASPGHIVLAVLAAFGVGIACGLVNGALVAYLNAPPILATLGTSQLFAGLALVASGNTLLKGIPDAFTAFGNTAIVGVPAIFWVALVVIGLIWLLVSRTNLGFQMRLIGSNEQAARYSGVPIKSVLIKTYVFSALISALAGLTIMAKTQGANPNYGATYILLAVVVAILAGVDPDGGRIAVVGVVVATLALQMLSLGLTSYFVQLGMSNVSENLFQVLSGLLLVIVMLLGHWSDRLTARREERLKLARMATANNSIG